MTADASEPIAVITIDDHDVIHAGVAAWLSAADPPARLVGGYRSASAFLAAQPRPTCDVLLFDLQYHGDRPAFAALRTLCEDGQRVVAYTHMSSDEVILTCLEAGASAVLMKSESQAHLVAAVHAAHADEAFVAPRMARALLNDRTVGRPGLSDREREVLIAWFQTESKDLVARRLFVAGSTVCTHLARVRAKYAAVGRPAPTKAALVAQALRDGIISLDDLEGIDPESVSRPA